MAGRPFLALMALLALLFAGLHPAAMAGPALPVVEATFAEPCHEAATPKPVKADRPANADCCPDGCDGQCTPAAAFFAAPAAKLLAFLRAVVDAPALARAPNADIRTAERPPRPLA
jgi:hypothetical protein